MRVPALVLMMALAGCFGGDGDGGGDSDGPPDDGTPGVTAPTGPPPNTTGDSPVIPLLLAFGFTGCEGVTVMQDQTAAEVQSLLPDGFVAAPNPVTQQEGSAVLAIDVFVCDQLATPQSTVNDTTYGQLYTFIEQPSDVFPSAPGVPASEYVFGVLGGQDILPVLWATAGYRSHDGAVTHTIVPTGPTGARIETYMVGDYGASAATHAVVSTALPIPIEADFARYTLLADGSLLLWTGHYDIPQGLAGVGTFSVPDDDPFSGFEDQGGLLRGASLTYPEGAMTGMDLRRYFPPFQ